MSDLITYDMLIDGEFVQASDGATFESINPATSAVIVLFCISKPRTYSLLFMQVY